MHEFESLHPLGINSRIAHRLGKAVDENRINLRHPDIAHLRNRSDYKPDIKIIKYANPHALQEDFSDVFGNQLKSPQGFQFPAVYLEVLDKPVDKDILYYAPDIPGRTNIAKEDNEMEMQVIFDKYYLFNTKGQALQLEYALELGYDYSERGLNLVYRNYASPKRKVKPSNILATITDFTWKHISRTEYFGLSSLLSGIDQGEYFPVSFIHSRAYYDAVQGKKK